MRIHEDTSGSFLTALTPMVNLARTVASDKIGALYLLGLEISCYPLHTRLWASLFPLELQGRTCGRCKGLRVALKDMYQLRALKTLLCNTDYLNIS